MGHLDSYVGTLLEYVHGLRLLMFIPTTGEIQYSGS